MEEITHCGEATRMTAEMEILGQDGPSNLNPTISSSKDERATLEPVTDILLPWVGDDTFLLYKACRRTAARKR
ncbi:hypothetical protein ACLB2K_050602 [Fragaria x ananassa]